MSNFDFGANNELQGLNGRRNLGLNSSSESQGGLGCFFLIFMIADLAIGYGDSQCVHLSSSSMDMTLATWLKVDGFTKLGVLTGLIAFIVMMVVFAQRQGGEAGIVGTSVLMVCALIGYGIFNLIWLIIGAMIFWGGLSDSEECEGGIKFYMYVLYIVSFLSCCCSCANSSRNRY